MVLNPEEASMWTAWDTVPEAFAIKLADKGFARRLEKTPAPDSAALEPVELSVSASPFVKWHRESSDLTILFDARLTAHNNPLLVLGPYGSLCWRGLTEGWPLHQISREAVRVFGADEVTSFVNRLSELDFVSTNGRLRDEGKGEQIPKEFAAPEVQFQLRQAAVPWYCLWEMATACDLRCKVCYLPGFNDRGPSPDSALDIADQIIAAGIFYVCLLGGEVLLRKDLEAIVSRLRSAGVFVKIITNGQRLTLHRSHSLAAAGLNMVEVSFDGVSRQTHELSRGPGTFARTLEALESCKAAGIPRLGAVITMHSGNLSEAERIPEFLDEIGVTECYLSPFKKSGLNGASAPWEPPTSDQLHALRASITHWRETHPHLTVTLLSSCSCGRTSVVIGANGDVRLCSFTYSSVGNVLHSSLTEIWNSLHEARFSDGPLGYCSALRKAA